MNTSIRDAWRRAGGRDPSGPAGESIEARPRWRTTLAGAVVAAMALGGMTALAATPAAADELPPAASEQAVAEQVESAPVEEPAAAPVEEPAPAPVEAPAPAPVEEPAAAPVEEATPAPAPVAEAEAPAEAAVAAEAVAPEAEAPVVALLVPPGEEVVDKVEICHATASYSNPYVINEPAADGDVSGHAGHTGEIFYPEIEEQWGDIIPPFYYDDGGEEPAFFPGLNWDAEGQAIYENDCVFELPELGVTAMATGCSFGDDGTALVSLSGMIVGEDYDWSLVGGDVLIEDTLTAPSTSLDVPFGDLPPGTYTFTITWSEDDDVTATAMFTVEECEPVVVEKVEICHATGSYGNPYVRIEPDANGTVSGHADHTGPVFYPEIEEDWGDIIPPFFYDDGDETPAFFPGLNWNAEGQAIYENDCEFELPELDVAAMATDCSLGYDGTALVSLSGLIVGEDYDWALAGGDVLIEDTLTAPSTSLDVPFGDLPPGTYTFTITWTEDEDVTATAMFTVEPCQPVISVVVTECPAYGEEGSALVRLSDLVEGVEYDVWVTARGDMNGTAYDGIRTITAGASHMAEIEFAPLPPGMDYTAWVHGVWADEDDEFELHASVDFTLEPCPAKPAKPAKHDKPAKPVKPTGLADTGVNDPTGPIAAALLLLGLGGAALIARARREGRTNHSE